MHCRNLQQKLKKLKKLACRASSHSQLHSVCRNSLALPQDACCCDALQAQEIATLKAQLEAKAQEAEGHQAAKVEAEQKYLKQVRAAGLDLRMPACLISCKQACAVLIHK